MIQLLGFGALEAFAAGEVLITAPRSGDAITGSYVLRYSVSNLDAPKTISIGYLDSGGSPVSLPVDPIISPDPSTAYTTLIKDLRSGENTITVAVTGESGQVYSHEVVVTVTERLTNIMNQAENVQPYTADPNKYMNLLKQSNSESAKSNGKIPKENSYIYYFVNTLLAEAAKENIRPDVVFAQMMLETGWLNFLGDVDVTQNNFGGIGAVGGGVTGNVFKSISDGIRTNVQHLFAYASTDPLAGELVDPRFGYVKRGVSPMVEYLGYYENINGGGWAMGFQYGTKILDIMQRLANASPAKFSPSNAAVTITGFNVSPAVVSPANPLNVNLGGTFAVGSLIRMAVATNAHTEHTFKITNRTTGVIKEFPYTTDGAVFFTPETDGDYLFEVLVRPAGSGDGGGFPLSEELSITIGDPVVSDEEKYGGVDPRIGDVTLSASPYFKDQPVTLTVSGLTEAELTVNEYRLEAVYGGVRQVINDWSANQTFTYTPPQAGTHTLILSSRNRYVSSPEAVHSNESTINVEAEAGPIDLIASVEASEAPYLPGKAISIRAVPVTGGAIVPEYHLSAAVDGVETIAGVWQTSPVFSYVPAKAGRVQLKISARDSVLKPSVPEDEASLELTVEEIPAKLSKVVISPSPYPVGKAITFTAIPEGNSGLVNEYALLQYKAGEFFKTLSAYSEDPVKSFTPKQAGEYEIRLSVRDKYLKSPFYSDAVEFKLAVTAKPSPVKRIALSSGPLVPGRTITVQAELDEQIGGFYEYALVMVDPPPEEAVADWNKTGQFVFTPREIGEKTLQVKYREVGSLEVAGTLDQPITIQAIPAVIDSVTVSPGPYKTGFALGFSVQAGAAAQSVSEYRLLEEVPAGDKELRSWQESGGFNHTPTTGGNKVYRIESRNKYTKGAVEDRADVSVNVLGTAGAVKDILADKPLVQGIASRIQAVIAPEYLPSLEYKLQTLVLGVPTDVSLWQATPVFNFTPGAAGSLTFRVALRWAGTDSSQSSGYLDKTLTVGENIAPAMMKYIWVTPGPYYHDKALTVTAVPEAGSELISEYRALVYTPDGYTPATPWQDKRAMTFQPGQTGAVRIRVESRNQLTKLPADAEGFIINVLPGYSASVYAPAGYIPENRFHRSIESIQITGIKAAGKIIRFTGVSSTPTDLRYRFILTDKTTGVRSIAADWNSNPTLAWTAPAGSYTLTVEVRDPLSLGFYDDSISREFTITGTPTVYLDPGHGGSNSGAVVTATGITYYEKALNLEMGNLIQAKLQGRGYRVVMSRTGDTGLTNGERIARISQADPDVVLSLHHNSAANAAASGFLTIYAAAGPNPAESSELGTLIAEEMAYAYTVNRGAKADMAAIGRSIELLNGITPPAVDVEFGFMTNSTDLIRMKSPWFKNLIADRLVNGVVKYLAGN